MALGRTNVALYFRSMRKISAIDFPQYGIYLACEDALVSETFQCNTESAEASEQINESHVGLPQV